MMKFGKCCSLLESYLKQLANLMVLMLVSGERASRNLNLSKSVHCCCYKYAFDHHDLASCTLVFPVFLSSFSFSTDKRIEFCFLIHLLSQIWYQPMISWSPNGGLNYTLLRWISIPGTGKEEGLHIE